MRATWTIPGLVLGSLLGYAVILPVVQGNGLLATAIQMDRSSGDKRQTLQVCGVDVAARPDTPMWFAEHATERSGEWVIVHRRTGQFGLRECWKWGSTHMLLRTFGESLRIMNAPDDVVAAAACEILRLIRSEDRPGYLRDVMENALTDLWDRVDAGEAVAPDDVRSAFGDAETAARTHWNP